MSEININRPDYIIPFSTTVGEFEDKIKDIFISGDYVPRDIFDYVSFDDIRPIYIPMFLYEGRYYVDWDCQLAREEKYLKSDSEGNSKEKTRVVYYPYNGTAKESFSILSVAYEGNDLFPELAAFAKTLPYDPTMAKAFDPKYLTDMANLVTLNYNQDKETIWKNSAIDIVKRAANSTVKEQLGNKKYKDLKCNVMFEDRQETRLIFVPFWFVRFEYKGSQYHIIMDGSGKSINQLLPVDKATLKATRRLRNQTRCAICAVAAFSILLFFVKFNFQAWGNIRWIIIALMWGSYFTMAIMNRRKAKAIVKEARVERRQGLPLTKS